MKGKVEAYDDKNTKPEEMAGGIQQLYRCIVCDYSCSKKSVFFPSCTNSICSYSFSQKSSLESHVKSVHDGKKIHKCSICDYRCSKESNLRRHLKSVHEGKKPHKFSICDYSCSQKVHMESHVESVHE